MATLSDIFPESLETYTGDLQSIRLSETPSWIVLFTQVIGSSDSANTRPAPSKQARKFRDACT